MKKFWILTIIIVLAFSACNSGGNDEASSTPTPPSDTASEQPAENTDPTPEPVESTPTPNPTPDPEPVEPDPTPEPDEPDEHPDDCDCEECDETEEQPVEPDEPTTPEPATPSQAIAPASGNVIRYTHGTDWGSLVLNRPFTSGEYTVTLVVLHNSVSFGVEPLEHPQQQSHNVWNFLDAEGEVIGRDEESPAGRWNEFQFTFPGNQTGGGLRFNVDYPRTVGDIFYLDNIVITNAAGEVVYSNDFEAGEFDRLAGADWDESTVEIVPMP